MQNTELRVRVRPGGSVGGRRRDDLHARTGVRYEAGRCARRFSARNSLCVLLFLFPHSHFPPTRCELSHFRLVSPTTDSARYTPTFTFGFITAYRVAARYEKVSRLSMLYERRASRLTNVRILRDRCFEEIDTEMNLNSFGGENGFVES